MDSLTARDMAAVFVNDVTQQAFDVLSIDDLSEGFGISEAEAMEVFFQIGSAYLSLHWDECVCGNGCGDDEDPLADVVLGDPDPMTYDVDYVCCSERSGQWMCTREMDHPGQHIAGDGFEVCAVWL